MTRSPASPTRWPRPRPPARAMTAALAGAGRPRRRSWPAPSPGRCTPSARWSTGTARELHGHCRRLLRSPSRPRTRCRRRCCGPGGPARTSPGAPRSAPGSTGSPPTPAWTRSATTAGRPGRRLGLRTVPSTSRTSCREPASTDPGPDVLLETKRDPRGRLPHRHRAAAAPAARRADPLRGAALLVGRDRAPLGTTVAAVNSARQRARVTLHGARPARAAALRAAPRARTSAARAVRRRDPPARRRHAHGPGQGRRLRAPSGMTARLPCGRRCQPPPSSRRRRPAGHFSTGTTDARPPRSDRFALYMTSIGPR